MTSLKPAAVRAPALPEKVWTYNPSAEKQLEQKIEALSSIRELAQQIKDPEIFRKWAIKLVEQNCNFTTNISITFPSAPKRKLPRKPAR